MLRKMGFSRKGGPAVEFIWIAMAGRVLGKAGKVIKVASNGELAKDSFPGVGPPSLKSLYKKI